MKINSSVTFGQCDGGLVGVDGVEDTLISDLGLGDEADLGAEVGNSAATGHDSDDPSLLPKMTISVKA